MYIEIHQKDKTLITEIEKTFSVFHPLVEYEMLYKSDNYFESSFVQFLDREELDYSLKAIFPRIGNNKTGILNQVIASKDLKTKRYFLFSYWRNFSDDPKSIYDKYMEVAKAIDVRYANNVGYGFETDRGHYFLKYGRPSNIVTVVDEPSAPPYEIWIYNYMPETQETNVRFLFYNPSLVSNDFRLLHSTCRGEVSNPRWELELYIDDTQGQNNNFLDGRTTQDNFNRNARRFFTDL
ncbi:GWxTD domain-containing protein [Saprospiraceae bacterium]|nr:GWxTD domain-containing protein [Saprospiraceae bacterium]